MPRNIDTALLRAFAVVAETGGMTKAAQHLSLTQAAVSQQVKRLEESFGCVLVERDRRGFRLTPNGERLLVRARRLLAINDEIWSTMLAPQFSGEIRLGIPSDIVRAYLPPLLRSFHAAWPMVRVTLVCDTSERVKSAARSGAIDLAMTTEAGCEADGEALFKSALVWAGASAGRAYTLDPLPIATGDGSCPFRPIVLAALSAAGRDWRSVCEIASFEPICANVEADLAVAPLLASTVPQGMQILSERDGLPRLPEFSVNLYVPPVAAKDAALELASHIRAHLAAPATDTIDGSVLR